MKNNKFLSGSVVASIVLGGSKKVIEEITKREMYDSEVYGGKGCDILWRRFSMKKGYEEILRNKSDEEIWVLYNKLLEERVIQDIVNEVELDNYTHNCCDFVEKISKIPVLGNIAINIDLFRQMLVDSFRKEYSISTMTKCSIMLALLYFIAPMDLIPDIIPVLGMLDDALVLRIAGGMLLKELGGYKGELYKKNSDRFLDSVNEVLSERLYDVTKEEFSSEGDYVKKEVA